jgi:NADPH-dependent ferric siderophore reductase
MRHAGRGADLARAVRASTFGSGPVEAFVYGEGDGVRRLRRHLLRERGLDRGRLSISGYWRRSLNDEAWRAVKAAAEESGCPVPVPTLDDPAGC